MSTDAMRLDAERAEFFARIRSDQAEGRFSIVSEYQLHRLWPGANGRFDLQAAHDAFSRENLHWVWLDQNGNPRSTTNMGG